MEENAPPKFVIRALRVKAEERRLRIEGSTRPAARVAWEGLRGDLAQPGSSASAGSADEQAKPKPKPKPRGSLPKRAPSVATETDL